MKTESSSRYGIVSDLHFHNWSQFASVNESGVNTRLTIIIEAMRRAATELTDRGIDVMIIAGDIFHVRGRIAPSVLNPVLDCFSHIVQEMGISVYAIPGNHDLENKESDELGNAIKALTGAGVFVCDNSFIMGEQRVVIVPWYSTIKGLLDELALCRSRIEKAGGDPAKYDVVIHAPLDGVIPGIPEHGLNSGVLGSLGFKRVFAGHYHHHKNFDDRVYSIGALTHQKWSDVGAKAGSLIVEGDKVTHVESNAPRFIDFSEDWEDDEMEDAVDGNYVRVQMTEATPTDIAEIRDHLNGIGAAGVVIHATRKTTTTRTGATVKSGASLEVSVAEYVESKKFKREKDVQKACASILVEARGEE